MICALVTTSDAGSAGNVYAPLQAQDDTIAIESVLRNLVQSPVDGIVVVTGYQRRVLERLLERRPCRLVHDWSWYLGDRLTSIQLGLRALPDDVEAVLVCAGDDLSLTPSKAAALVEHWQAQGGERLLQHEESHATQAATLIPRTFWPELQSLQPHRAFEAFMQGHRDQVERITAAAG